MAGRSDGHRDQARIDVLKPRLSRSDKNMKQRPPLKITGRTSSITTVLSRRLIPRSRSPEGEQQEALAHLGMTPDNLHCVYCGATSDRLGPFKGHGEEKTTNRLHRRNPQSRSFLRPLQSIQGARRLARVDDGQGARFTHDPERYRCSRAHGAASRVFEAWSNVRPIAFGRTEFRKRYGMSLLGAA